MAGSLARWLPSSPPSPARRHRSLTEPLHSSFTLPLRLSLSPSQSQSVFLSPILILILISPSSSVRQHSSPQSVSSFSFLLVPFLLSLCSAVPSSVPRMQQGRVILLARCRRPSGGGGGGGGGDDDGRGVAVAGTIKFSCTALRLLALSLSLSLFPLSTTLSL